MNFCTIHFVILLSLSSSVYGTNWVSSSSGRFLLLLRSGCQGPQADAAFGIAPKRRADAAVVEDAIDVRGGKGLASLGSHGAAPFSTLLLFIAGVARAPIGCCIMARPDIVPKQTPS